jgi:hypothetical protein
MKKSVSMLVAMTLMLSLFVGLSGAAFADDATGTGTGTTVNTDVEAQVADYKEIVQMFTDNKPLADIRAKYVADFEAGVKAIDAGIKPGDKLINENVMFVLNSAVDGKMNAGQAKQAVDKGLQWYLYFLLKDFLNKQAKPALAADDKAAALAAVEKAEAIWTGVLESTAVKRDNKFGTKIANEIGEVAFTLLKQDVEAGNVNGFDVHRQIVDKTLIKMFSLAVLTYAESIPTKAAADQPAAMTEAYFFYATVYGYLRPGSASDADYIEQVFASGDASKVNLADISAAMARAMTGKFSEYAGKTLDSLAQGNQNQANVLAMEGVMFFASQETLLGAEAYKAAYPHGEALLAAAAAGDQEGVKAASFRIAKALSAYQGVSFKAGSAELFVNGEAHTASTTAFISKDTNRTLVPVRYAELLGFTVAWDSAAKAVTLTKGKDMLVLTQGQDTVTKNGEVLADTKLDQPVVSVEGTNYIPLRAVAELTGNHVYYLQGEVVVVK